MGKPSQTLPLSGSVGTTAQLTQLGKTSGLPYGQMVDIELERGGYASHIGWLCVTDIDLAVKWVKRNYTCKLKIAFHWEISRPVGAGEESF